jgi:hypothetical protein
LASAGLLAASCLPSGASAAKTDDTDFSCCSRTAAMSAGFSSGTPGTYQRDDGSSSSAPSAAHSTICVTSALQDPQPLPALVCAITPLSEAVPDFTHEAMSPLLTPLQLQTWASSASSAAPTAALGAPMSNSSCTRSSGSGRPRSKACMR